MKERRKMSFESFYHKFLMDNKKKYTLIGCGITAVHMIYAVIMSYVKVWPLAIYNTLSVLFYLYFSLVIVQKKKYLGIYFAAVLEVSTCAILTTVLLGHEWQFMLFTIALIPVSFYLAYTLPGVAGKSWLPGVTSLFVSLNYFGMDFYSRRHMPIYHGISRGIQITLHYFNTFIALILILIFSWLFAYEVLYMQKELQLENLRLEEMAKTDSLTLLLNRHTAEEYFREWIRHAQNTKESFSVIMGDVDNFKRINDTYGHLEGDRILCMIGTVIKNNIRQSDKAFRWGGEEFLVLLAANRQQAVETALRIQKELADNKIWVDEKRVDVTITIGISTYQEGMTSKELIKQADDRLYEGKSRGKNRVLY